MTDIGEQAWSLIHPSVRNAAQATAAIGRFDDAIFAAYRIVEASVQERIQSRAIGQALIAEAFDGPDPAIDLAEDARDREALKQLFAGALGHIRNDRSHKKMPAIPCPDAQTCFQFLATASLLLFYLDQDRRLRPRIAAFQVTGTAASPSLQIHGERLDRVRAIARDGSTVSSSVRSPTLLEVSLPPDYVGVVALHHAGGDPLEVLADTRALLQRPQSHEIVLAADMPLFSDADCLEQRQDVVGLLLLARQGGGRPFTRIYPAARGAYHVGQYVTHGPFETSIVGPTWYVDATSNQRKSAWSGSAVARPSILGASGRRRHIGISILPGDVRLGQGERRCLRVRAFGVDGPASTEHDVTMEVSWSTSAEQIAYVKGGALYGKEFGEATIEARWKDLIATARVRVVALTRGTVVKYFQGLRHLQQIAFDRSDNLYCVNQSESVFCISTDGRFTEAVRIEMDDSAAYGIDCVHLASNDELYLSNVARREALRLRRRDGRFQGAECVGTSVGGTKKAIVSDQQGRVFVAVMGNGDKGQILRIDPDGREAVFQTPDMAIYLAIAPDGSLCTPSTRYRAVHVFNGDGELIETIHHGCSDSAAGIAVDQEGAILLPFFHSGRLLRIDRRGDAPVLRFIADGLGTPGGIAVDSRGRVYVSDFAGDAIRMLL